MARLIHLKIVDHFIIELEIDDDGKICLTEAVQKVPRGQGDRGLNREFINLPNSTVGLLVESNTGV